jgi:chemotaxis protein methyltransferase CheR
VQQSFRNLAVRYLGIDICKKWEPLVGARITKQLGHLGIPLHKYLLRLYEDKDAREIVAFWDLIRPRPAAFFVQWSDYLQLHAYIVQGLDRGRRKFRFWSAGCWSGEEAYAMAITAHNAAQIQGVAPDSVDLMIVATDVSAKAMQTGKRGVFEMSRVRQVPRHLLERYFHPSCGGVAVSPYLQSQVVFTRLNLAHPPFSLPKPIDVIFCHEGLASMVPEARVRTIRGARALLSEGGLLRAGFEDELARAMVEPKESEEVPRALGAEPAPGDC